MRHAFFDLDGTLTDPALGIVRCFQHALRALSGPAWADAELRQFIGPPLRPAFQAIFRTDDTALVERAIGAYRERFGSEGLYENAVYPEIPDVLAKLRHAGFQLWVVTSKPHVYADRIIDHFGLREHFARVYGAELSGARSEKAELIEHVLREERIDPASTCMIGDRRHDIEGARANGVAGLGVLWGYGSREELERAGAADIVESVAAIPGVLARLTASCS
jgi:phosphoglycolate phosphatase